jgi:hypothetical protein
VVVDAALAIGPEQGRQLGDHDAGRANHPTVHESGETRVLAPGFVLPCVYLRAGMDADARWVAASVRKPIPDEPAVGLNDSSDCICTSVFVAGVVRR